MAAPNIPQSRRIVPHSPFPNEAAHREQLVLTARHHVEASGAVPEKRQVDALLGPQTLRQIESLFASYDVFARQVLWGRISPFRTGGGDAVLLEVLKSYVQRTGRLPTSSDLVRDLSMPLPLIFSREFGSLERALQQADLVDAKGHAQKLRALVDGGQYLQNLRRSLQSLGVVVQHPVQLAYAASLHAGVGERRVPPSNSHASNWVDYLSHNSRAIDDLVAMRRSVQSEVPLHPKVVRLQFLAQHQRVYGLKWQLWVEGVDPVNADAERYLEFVWSDTRLEYALTQKVGIGVMPMVEAWLTAQGVAPHHPVERSLVASILDMTIKPKRGEAAAWVKFRAYFSPDPYAALVRLLDIAVKLDGHLDPHASFRLSFLNARLGDGRFSGVALEPWGVAQPFENNVMKTQLVFVRDAAGRPRLQRYYGNSSTETAQWFVGAAPAASALEARLRSTNSSGRMSLTWGELRQVMRDARLRDSMFATIWRGQHPKDPLPMSIIMEMVGRPKDETAYVNTLRLYDRDKSSDSDRPTTYNWLIFGPNAQGRRSLLGMQGSGGIDLVEDHFLSTLGPLDTVERYVMAEALGWHLSERDPEKRVTKDRLMAYLGDSEADRVARLLDVRYAGNPRLERRPQVATLTGLVNGDELSNVSLPGDHALRRSHNFKFEFHWVENGGYSLEDRWLPNNARHQRAMRDATRQAIIMRRYGRVAAISAEEARQNYDGVRGSPDGIEPAARAILAQYGVAMEHPVERAMVLRALGVEKLDRQISVAAAQDFFRTGKDQAALRFLTLLKPFDARLAGDLTSGVRVSFLINTTNDAASTFSLVPISHDVGWAENPYLTQLLFVPREGRWPLNQYHGISGKEWADGVGVAPHALVPPRHWVASKGQIMPPWGELRATLQEPLKRQWLYELLWREKYPGRPLPEQRLLVASRNGESDAIPARALDALDATPFLNTNPPNHLARLFSVDDDGRDRLTGFDGRGGQDLAKSVLAGDGHLPTHPLEFALVMGHLCRKQFRHPLSLQDAIGYFSLHGHAGVERVVKAIAAVDPAFPKDAARFALAAWIDGKVDGDNRLTGLKMVQEADFVAEFAHNYALWVEYEKGPDGKWRATPSEREAGRRVATAGGRVIAPDADAIDQAAEEVRRLTQAPGGFEPLDENMCKNEPLITPAELMKVEPVVNVPVAVERGTPGFAPTPLTPQELAIPPSTDRHAGPVPHSNQPASSPGSPLVIEPRGGDDGSVTLPATIGGEVFLPEPPLGMVVAGDVIVLGGIAIVVAASAIEIPAGLALGVGRGVHAGLTVGRPILAY